MTSSRRPYLAPVLWTIATIIVAATLWIVAYSVSTRVSELHLFVGLSFLAGLFILYLALRPSPDPVRARDYSRSPISTSTKRFVITVALALVFTVAILRPMSPYLADVVPLAIAVFCALYLAFRIPALVRCERRRIQRGVEEDAGHPAKPRGSIL